MNIQGNTVVTMHYTLKNAEGETIDSSVGQEPLAYLHGNMQIVPGLEKQLEGKAAGDKVSAVVPPAEGYGVYDENLVLQVPLEAFPEEMRGQLELGVQFLADHPESQEQIVQYTVVRVEGDAVIVDGNHELSDVELHFEVEIVDVRAATDEEVKHGHAHGPGGHHHH